MKKRRYLVTSHCTPLHAFQGQEQQRVHLERIFDYDNEFSSPWAPELGRRDKNDGGLMELMHTRYLVDLESVLLL